MVLIILMATMVGIRYVHDTLDCLKSPPRLLHWPGALTLQLHGGRPAGNELPVQQTPGRQKALSRLFFF